MNFLIFLIIWYIVGVISSFIGVMIHDGRLNLRDIVLNFTIGGLLGFITTIATIGIILGSDFFDKEIWRSK